MIIPELYVVIDQIQRIGAQRALQEFVSVINWRCDKRDSVLDAGCGPGDITVDILMPILPANFERLVGVDISEAMLNYARKTYVRPKLSFEQFDLCTDLEKHSFRGAEAFDHIFSFYVLMWTTNLEKCIQNFYKLLRPNGDILLLYVNGSLFHELKQQSLEKRWAKYMWDVDEKSPPFQYSKQVQKDFCDLLSKHGFADCEVRIRERNYSYKNLATLREFLTVVSPCIHRMPIEEREQYMDDLMRRLIKGYIRPNGDGDADPIILPFEEIMVYARKKM